MMNRAKMLTLNVYIYQGDKCLGPYSGPEILTLTEEGQFNAKHDMVWHEGLSDTIRLSEFLETLKALKIKKEKKKNMNYSSKKIPAFLNIRIDRVFNMGCVMALILMLPVGAALICPLLLDESIIQELEFIAERAERNEVPLRLYELCLRPPVIAAFVGILLWVSFLQVFITWGLSRILFFEYSDIGRAFLVGVIPIVLYYVIAFFIFQDLEGLAYAVKSGEESRILEEIWPLILKSIGIVLLQLITVVVCFSYFYQLSFLKAVLVALVVQIIYNATIIILADALNLIDALTLE